VKHLFLYLLKLEVEENKKDYGKISECYSLHFFWVICIHFYV